MTAQNPANGAGQLANVQQRPRPTLDEAMRLLTAAEAASAKKGLFQACIVVDSRGDVVARGRMDKARFWTADVAEGKARLAAMFGEPSESLNRLSDTPLLSTLTLAAQGNLYPIAGGLPLVRGDELVGAIGCGGAGPAQDEDTAKAAVAAIPLTAAPVADISMFTLADAEKLIDRAQQVASELKSEISIAVVDDRGDLMAFARMASANANTADAAIGKAMMSAILVRSSGPITPTGAASQAFRDIDEKTGKRLRFEQGGLLITRKGRIVAAAGVSGAVTAAKDEDILKSALAAVVSD